MAYLSVEPLADRRTSPGFSGALLFLSSFGAGLRNRRVKETGLGNGDVMANEIAPSPEVEFRASVLALEFAGISARWKAALDNQTIMLEFIIKEEAILRLLTRITVWKSCKTERYERTVVSVG